MTFDFHEEDKEGRDTLDVISSATRFNRWMYQTIRPYCQGNILEIGSGIGNISRFFLDEGAAITLSDIRKSYCNHLEEQFSGYKNLKDIRIIDLAEANFEKKYSDLFECFDSIFALNVIEHIKYDSLAIKNAGYLLKKGGQLVILVPAYMFLYNRFDKELEHFRRYTRKTLGDIFIKNDFQIIHSRYFNAAGIPGWYVSGKLQKNKTIPASQMDLYNRLVPVFKWLDRILFKSAGLSVITIGRK